MARRLPPLSALRVFEAAGRCGSFAAAAAELTVTPSAVSHAVRTLEDALGHPLFRREPRGPVLTPAGRDLLMEATIAFDGLSGAMARLATKRAETGLLISAAPTFAARWLTPKLADLRRLHPALEVSITTEKAWVQLGDGHCDLAIRMSAEARGEGAWRMLGREWLVPLAAPAALQSIRATSTEAVLRALPAICVTTVQEEWDAWMAQSGFRPTDRARGLRFDTIHMALEAAAQGLGVVMGRLPVASGEIAAGRLVPLGQAVVGTTAYWVVARPGLLRQRDARHFVGWLHSRFDAEATG